METVANFTNVTVTMTSACPEPNVSASPPFGGIEFVLILLFPFLVLAVHLCDRQQSTKGSGSSEQQRQDVTASEESRCELRGSFEKDLEEGIIDEGIIEELQNEQQQHEVPGIHVVGNRCPQTMRKHFPTDPVYSSFLEYDGPVAIVNMEDEGRS
ncbi:unnamed protein product [Cyprideis torosa]|uniref:Uncharacterized protein n=1 Tax=Cyprideis torosa TaxID=163714 RepID=A0A7R8WF66_9CRUS|nr:unnamed protein product [Cyprideis torosa]CAG0891547.1 unnamed protein product [Cyprideis torosa]